MPNTKVFNGYSSSGTSYGSIAVKARRNAYEADITFTDKAGNTTEGVLSVYTLKDMKRLEEFRTATELPAEPLVHQWMAKKTDRHLFKYSSSDELAIGFAMENPSPSIEEAFVKLTAGLFLGIKYFDECKFIQFLASQKLTLNQLKQMPGMSESKVKLLCEKTTSLSNLVEHGLTLEQMGNISEARFELLAKNQFSLIALFNDLPLSKFIDLPEGRVKFFADKTYYLCEFKKSGMTFEQMITLHDAKIDLLVENSLAVKELLRVGATFAQICAADISALTKVCKSHYNLRNALGFVTIKQVLGLNHIPPAVPVAQAKAKKNASITAAGTCGEFATLYESQATHVTHTNSITKVKTQLSVCPRELTEQLKVDLDSRCKTIKPQKLVHDWYVMTIDPSQTPEPTVFIYCPSLNQLLVEICEHGFPVDKFEDVKNLELWAIPYYAERLTSAYFKKIGHPLETLRTMPGMTERKIESICEAHHELDRLFKAGLSMGDIATIDEDRLTYVSSNFQKAGEALNFVDARELFGLNESMPNHSPAFFAATATPVADASSSSSSTWKDYFRATFKMF